MTRPEQPQPKQRSKATQTVTTPTGYSFEYCIDEDKDCDITEQINVLTTSLSLLFGEMDKEINNFYNYTDSIKTK
jgi:hypothetical protein